MNDTARLIGAFLCVMSQLRTPDAVEALVAIIAAAQNSGYEDGYKDGQKPMDVRRDTENR